MLHIPSYAAIGDIAPAFMGTDQENENCILYGLAGSPVIIVFSPGLQAEHYSQLLLSLAGDYEAFTQAGAKIIAIGLGKPEDHRAFANRYALPYPLLSASQIVGHRGREIAVLQEYNVAVPSEKMVGKWDFMPTVMLIDYNSRIRKTYPFAVYGVPSAVQLLADITALLPIRESRVVQAQAPVLFIDNVLSEAECALLIKTWEEQGNVDSGSMKTIDGKTVGVYDYDTKIRRDHFIKDKALLESLDIIIRRRVFPQIKKAFHFDCTRREDYKIACYDAGRGGYFRKHRDNTTAATAHRIWAMSLNLNADAYEGGYVKFPEYSEYCYKPQTGAALIFSGSMMHEATDVYNGRRFVLLQFFYGEAQADIRKKNLHLLVGE